MPGVEERVALASNELTPAETLAGLGRDRSAPVRRAVATNRATPPEVLGRLAADKDHAVLGAVARNPATPPDALWTLARQNRSLRGTVAGNVSVPVDLLAALASDADEGVRFWTTFNPRTTDEILEALARDPHSKVRTRAVQALEARREIERQRRPGARSRSPRPAAAEVGAEPAIPAVPTTADGTLAGGLWEQPPGGPDEPTGR